MQSLDWTGLIWSGLDYWTPSRIEKLALYNILGFTDAIKWDDTSIKAIAICAYAMESTHLGCSYHTGTATEPTNDSTNLPSLTIIVVITS